MRLKHSALASGTSIALLALTLSCGGGGSLPSTSMGVSSATVTVTLSDPAVCGSPQGGPFQHIYVTIAGVRAYSAADASPNGGTDLAPGLSDHPLQLDLLGSSQGCILATISTSTNVPPGSYPVVRVFLAGSDQVAKIAGGNKCGATSYGTPANCAVLADGSEIYLDPVTTGSYPYTASIMAGAITLAPGEQTLNIDFDACASMWSVYAGDYGMDPVMRAALMPAPGTITGTVLDANTQQPIAGTVIVALEQLDKTGVDREIMQAAPGSNGSFVLCPVPAGTYDVVAVARDSSGVSYSATVVSGVQPGHPVGAIALEPLPGTNTAAIVGQITANSQGAFAGYAHVVVSALQAVLIAGTSRLVTVPLVFQHASTLRTQVNGSNNYEISVPTGNPLVAVSASGGPLHYQQNSAEAPAYYIDVQADSCASSFVRTPSPLTVSAGATVTAPVLALAGCGPA